MMVRTITANHDRGMRMFDHSIPANIRAVFPMIIRLPPFELADSSKVIPGL
jgi:hypothetical protein